MTANNLDDNHSLKFVLWPHQTKTTKGLHGFFQTQLLIRIGPQVKNPFNFDRLKSTPTGFHSFYNISSILTQILLAR